ncbi:hypothetical protein L7F22_024805 [Adiantum nelumboides]|nr:hypothetical protein [Adiantum nelumboides]
MTTFRTILGLVAIEDMELVQMDVKINFLHVDPDEDVYMQQLEGFIQEDARCQELVCKLKKALYEFDACMRSQAYKRSKEDHCLYTKKLDDGSMIILVLYIDDMLITRKSTEKIANLKKTLSNSFVMKDLGDAKYFLGMQIKRDFKRCILELSQETYIHKVLQAHSTAPCARFLSLAMDSNLRKSPMNGARQVSPTKTQHSPTKRQKSQPPPKISRFVHPKDVEVPLKAFYTTKEDFHREYGLSLEGKDVRKLKDADVPISSWMKVFTCLPI